MATKKKSDQEVRETFMERLNEAITGNEPDILKTGEMIKQVIDRNVGHIGGIFVIINAKAGSCLVSMEGEACNAFRHYASTDRDQDVILGFQAEEFADFIRDRTRESNGRSDQPTQQDHPLEALLKDLASRGDIRVGTGVVRVEKVQKDAKTGRLIPANDDEMNGGRGKLDN